MSRIGTMLLVLVVSSSATSEAQTTDEQLQKAIDAGMKYPTREKYQKAGANGTKCAWASAFAMDGISKEVRFFTDYDVVAAAAAGANAEMRKFGVEAARKLPLVDALFATVSMTALGSGPVAHLKSKYSESGVHVVLQIGDSLIQPLEKDAPTGSGSSAEFGTLYTWYGGGNGSLLTGVPLGYSSQKFHQEFVFPISPSGLPKNIVAWVIDEGGKRKKLSCDLTGLRTLQN